MAHNSTGLVAYGDRMLVTKETEGGVCPLLGIA
jgi:hypothetical protein